MEVGYAAAVVAGLLSFVSPCVLPLVPAYLSFMTGVSVDDLRGAKGEGATLARSGLVSLSFVVGFSVVFVSLGASATVLGQVLLRYMTELSRVGGVLIVLFGLHYMGLFRIGVLNLEARFNLERKPPGLFGAFVIGLAFAFGWTPCIGPILAAILTIAGGRESVWEGIGLLGCYSLGLGIPFLLAGVGLNRFFQVSGRLRPYLHKVEVASGVLLVAVGVMIFLGDFSRLSVWLMEWFPGLARLG
ncbi:MAG: cytochrome c biogenesis protein CcdA [Magnetococcales bacterium]|nr:cytochrome c biogenesis protein CcdA [Magnetococcales bacterium]MBF0156022.1 cytochrome c biogenesis protein CcdA [Magnetococcales bacterium]